MAGYKFMKAQRKNFFFEKKKQKTFTNWSRARPRGAATYDQKFFGSFFQKRTAFFQSRLRDLV
jgi:hypothetical protein